MAWVHVRRLAIQIVEFPCENHLTTGGEQIISFWIYHHETHVFCRSLHMHLSPLTPNQAISLLFILPCKGVVDICMEAVFSSDLLPTGIYHSTADQMV